MDSSVEIQNDFSAYTKSANYILNYIFLQVKNKKTTPLSTSSVIAHCAQLRNKIYSFKIRHFQHSILAKICVTLSIHYSLIVSSIHCTANICFNRIFFNLSLD